MFNLSLNLESTIQTKVLNFWFSLQTPNRASTNLFVQTYIYEQTTETHTLIEFTSTPTIYAITDKAGTTNVVIYYNQHTHIEQKQRSQTKIACA